MARKQWSSILMLAAAAVVGAAPAWLLTSGLSSDDSDTADSSCLLNDRRTVVACNEEHHWELIGSTDRSFNLASFNPYPTDQSIWFVLYWEDCTQLALDEVSPDQPTAADLLPFS